jgi:hypothetical protein
MSEPKFTIEVIDDPVRNAETRSIVEAFDKNVDWLSSHWAEVLPAAYGKYVAVAGQQAFIADDWREAERLARDKYPDDKGLYIRYVNPHQGIRLYGYRGRLET